MRKRLLNDALISISMLMVLFGGCSINDELGNIQPIGIVMLFVGLGSILYIANGGKHEKNNKS